MKKLDRAETAAPSVAVATETELVLDGRVTLLVRPPDSRHLYVLAHGAGAGMRHVFMTEIAAALARRGVATLRWEFPFMVAGRPRTDAPAVAEAAVRAVWHAVRAHFASAGDPLPMFAGGKSFGGRMTSRAHAAETLADLCGIVFLGFPLHPPEKPGIERAEHLATASGPLLFVQGDRDDLADLALLRPVVASLGRRAKLHVVAHADHGFDVLVRSGRKHPDVLDEIASTVATWMDARVAARAKALTTSRSRAAPKTRPRPRR